MQERKCTPLYYHRNVKFETFKDNVNNFNQTHITPRPVRVPALLSKEHLREVTVIKELWIL